MQTHPQPAPVFLAPVACAVVGSRHGSPYGVAQFTAALVAAGGTVRTGCAAGVDTAALVAVAQAGGTFATVRAPATHAPAGGHVQVMAQTGSPQALAIRTRLVVTHAQALAVFPPSGGALALGPGSLLALREGLRRALPMFVAGPTPPSIGDCWQPYTVAGVAGWYRPTPRPVMPALF